MKCEIQEFIGYLHNTRGTSKNTEISYERDLRKLEQFLMREGIQDVYGERAVCPIFHIQEHCFYPGVFSVFMSEKRVEGKSCGNLKSTED